MVRSSGCAHAHVHAYVYVYARVRVRVTYLLDGEELRGGERLATRHHRVDQAAEGGVFARVQIRHDVFSQ